MSEIDDIVNEFLVESLEGLDQLDRDLVQLERNPTSKELIARIFRVAHTIKGTSGVLGFGTLTSVSHAGENLLSLLRDGKLQLTPSVVSALLAMNDAIREMLGKIEKSGADEGDYSGVIQAISNILGSSATTAPKVAKGLSGLAELKSGVESRLECVPAAAPSQPVALNPEGDAPGPRDSACGRPAPVTDTSSRLDDQVTAELASSSVRVDVQLLDKLMNLVGELVLARNQVLQFATRQQDTAFHNSAQVLNLITSELQESVMKARMQPIGNVWGRFPRIVRDLALSCGKRVDLAMDGSDTELDRTIVESIKDPLTHIIRNSIDHGIELPDERIAIGKPGTGRLSIRAFHEGGHVNLVISDDGAGIARDRVLQKAIAQRLTTPELAAKLSDKEILNLVFLPGLSTAAAVTSVSGRGVGMDVVKTNIERIGGSIDLQSIPGKGTTLKIKIPLTLAILPALMITSGGECFAIPQISLVELVRLEAGRSSAGIELVQGVPVYRLRGSLLPLINLNQVLGIAPAADAAQAVTIVVLQSDGCVFGLVVDEVNDTEEIVVKPLGRLLKGITAFAGATIMGDGRVALILDVLGIALKSKLARLAQRSEPGSIAANGEGGNAREQWLLFRIGEQQRLAVPLSEVARLEEIQSDSTERASGASVVQYRGQIMPLVSVAAVLGVPEDERSSTRQVIVCGGAGHSVGLVVDEIIDVVEDRLASSMRRGDSALLGSAVIAGRVTDLLDIAQVLKSAAVPSREMHLAAEEGV